MTDFFPCAGTVPEMTGMTMIFMMSPNNAESTEPGPAG